MPSPFKNSMEDGNEPSDGSPNPGANDNRADNFGDRKKTSGSGVEVPFNSGYPLPPDPHAPPGDMNPASSDEISDFGISDAEVGHNPSQLQYGLKK